MKNRIKEAAVRGCIYSTCIFAIGLLFAGMLGWDLRTGLSGIDPAHALAILAAGMLIGWKSGSPDED